MIKMADTCKPLGQFPVAEAEDIDFADGESLQKKLDDGSLGGGSGSWVGTQAKFDAYDKSQLKDAQEVIITDDYEVVNGNVYSTEETICGTWIDGKPIYRKVISGVTYGSGELSVNTEISDMATLINLVFMENGITASSYSKYGYNGTNRANTSFRIDKNTGVITTDARRSSIVGNDGIFIVEYTKTTDV